MPSLLLALPMDAPTSLLQGLLAMQLVALWVLVQEKSAAALKENLHSLDALQSALQPTKKILFWATAALVWQLAPAVQLLALLDFSRLTHLYLL
jgi:hypothetical protein